MKQILTGITDTQFINICNNADSMASACASVQLHFTTFKRYATKLGCYHTNQGGKCKVKNREYGCDLKDILDGKYPQYQTYKLKNRLISEGMKYNICEICGISEWNNKPLNMELDHIDGNKTNHNIDNLQILCPNCHAQTPTYRAKNIKSH